MRAWIVLSILWATPAWAQSEEMPVFAEDGQEDARPDSSEQYPNQGHYPTAGCPGGCPTGMACSADGVCEQVPSCAGGCPQGMACSADGVCEQVPSCAGGCPQGMVCSADGVCEAAPPPQPACTCPTGFACSPAGTCVPRSPRLQRLERAPDPEAAHRARRRATFGFASSGVVLALGLTAGIIRSVDDKDECSTCFHGEMPLLFGAALYHGLAGILTFGGSRAARRAGGRGNGFLRVVGWITWVGGLLGLVAAGAIASLDGSEPANMIYAFSGIAALGPLFWAADARIGARQADARAEAQQPRARRWAPRLGMLRDGTNVVGGTLGAALEL